MRSSEVSGDGVRLVAEPCGAADSCPIQRLHCWLHAYNGFSTVHVGEVQTGQFSDVPPKCWNIFPLGLTLDFCF